MAAARLLNRIRSFALPYLLRGVSPRQLALAVALGLALGVFPMLGTTTVLCFLAGAVFGLNQPVLQTVNYLVAPLQFLLLIPYIRLGELLFGIESMKLSLSQIKVMVQADLWDAILRLWDATLYAISAWAITAVPLVLIITLLLSQFFRRIRSQAIPKSSSQGNQSGKPAVEYNGSDGSIGR